MWGGVCSSDRGGKSEGVEGRGKRRMASMVVFFFKQKTAYEIGTGDWSSDVCSSDLGDKSSIHVFSSFSTLST